MIWPGSLGLLVLFFPPLPGMGTLRWLDILVIAVYLATLTGVGLRFSRRQKSTQRYFTAQRSIPGWAMGLSLLATLISSVTFIAYPGSAYAGDWSNLVPGLTVVPVLLVTVFVVIPFFRQAVGVSAYEYFGKRFGRGARVYSSLAYAVGHLSKMGFVFYLLALTVNSITAWKIDDLILIVGVMTIGYTMLGGIEAVIWADVIQGLILWLGVLICLCFLLLLPPGGPSAMLHAAWNSHKISLGSTAPDFSKPSILVLSLYGFSYYLQRYTCDQTVVQRYLVARTDRQAVRGVLIGSLLCVPVWVLFMLIGTLCWTFFKLTREALPAHFLRGDQAFPYFVMHHLPAGFAGLFIAALFGATMANLSSDLNSLAARRRGGLLPIMVSQVERAQPVDCRKSGGRNLRSHLHGRCERPRALQRKCALSLVYGLRDRLGRIGWTVCARLSHYTREHHRSIHRDCRQPSIYNVGGTNARWWQDR